MKKILFSMAISPMILLTACSSSDDIEAISYLSEIKVTEHEYKYGTAENFGELYEDYIYDSNKNLLKKETNYYSSVIKDRINIEYTYKYDNNNRLIEENLDGLSKSKSFYSYNSNNLVSEVKIYDEKGALDKTWTYEYDGTDRIIKAIESTTLGGDPWGYIHNYTYSENKTTDTTYSISDNSVFGIMEDEYDSNGNLISNAWTSGNTGKRKQQQGIIYEYNSNRQVSKETSWSMLPSNLTYKKYTYNEDGTIQKIHISYSYKTSESDLRYEYIYN